MYIKLKNDVHFPVRFVNVNRLPDENGNLQLQLDALDTDIPLPASLTDIAIYGKDNNLLWTIDGTWQVTSYTQFINEIDELLNVSVTMSQPSEV